VALHASSLSVETEIYPGRHVWLTTMLPSEILDQVTSLNSQHRELVSVINQLSRPSEVAIQSALDDLVGRIKGGFAEADRAIEVCVHEESWLK
jgi:hypothetical protein